MSLWERRPAGREARRVLPSRRPAAYAGPTRRPAAANDNAVPAPPPYRRRAWILPVAFVGFAALILVLG